MSSIDPFGRTDTLDDGMLEALVVRFEARGKHPLFSQMLHDYLDAMHVNDAGAVLDLGCGTGLAARAIAQHANFSGRVTGVDLSPYLVEAAQQPSIVSPGLIVREQRETSECSNCLCRYNL